MSGAVIPWRRYQSKHPFAAHYTLRKTRLHIKMDIAVNVRNTAIAKASLCGDLIISGTQIFLSTTSSYSHLTKSGSINISDQTALYYPAFFGVEGNQSVWPS